ncbi:MAG: fibronectin type III domain-containing protein [Verrucomicrobiales bacterium]|nr:fibronectin type III domain-containing protein [Verrucomicrobiales bacterium]
MGTWLGILGWMLSGLGLALEIQGEPLVEASERQAEIVWETDSVSGSLVLFGTRKDQMNQRAETKGEVDELHAVTLSGLTPGTTYYFSVGSKGSRLSEGSFTTTGTAPARPPEPAVPVKNAQPPAAPELPTLMQAPASRVTWGYLPSLEDHYERHGPDFKSVGPDHYAAQAWLFLQKAMRTGLPMKRDSEGTVRVWEGKTRTFAAYNSDGTTKTFFKPNDPSYWSRQPGVPVTPEEHPFDRDPPAPLSASDKK